MNRKAFIFYGGWDGHEPEKVSNRFKRILEAENFDVICEGSMDRLNDEEFLRSMDLIIPMWTQGDIPDPYVFHLTDAIASGVGLAGCHGGMCDAFRWNIEYQYMTGSQWVEHTGDKWYHHISDLSPENIEYVTKTYPHPNDAFVTDYEVNFKRNTDSPIVEGLPDFKVRTEQYYLHLDPCVNVLATTTVYPKDPTDPMYHNGVVVMPVVYTKRWGEGRVFYSSMGHMDYLFDDHPQMVELMRRGFLWAARKH